MKVGDYVRTKKGVIGKYNIIKTGETIPNWNGGYGYKEKEKGYIDNNIYNRFDDEIIKSSPNIIDLIEVGDYVNGTIVTKVVLDSIECNYIELDYSYNKRGIRNKDIKTVVTHEQMEAIQYRVEE